MNKKHLRGVLSLLLTLAMLLSLFAGLSLTAGAANNYAYNSGVRGTACTSLSSAAQSYWTGTYSFTNLNAKTGDTLRSALRAKITSNRSTVGYDGLKTYMPYTDAYQGSSSRITLYYSNYVGNSTWNGTNWNREHVWPDSLGGNAMEGDLHSMRPTDPTANSTRGNSKYANVRELYPDSYRTASTSSTNGSVTAGYYYSNTYFEPLDHAKGDAARILLYDYVVTDSMSAPTVAIKDIQTLLDWCALDPVDEFEMQRNDIVQTIEGCRNPFIDYPELAWRLYSSYTMPSGMVTPSSGSAFVVSASTNNSNYGTVSVSGYVITAIPAAGYYAKSYTILSGTPTVTQNGNTFTVAPTSNCSIRINFAAKQSVTVTLSANGSTSTQSGTTGEAMSLPTATAPTGYGFVGWVTSTVAETSTMPETIYSGTYTPTASITLYALYSHSGSGTGSGYTLVGADDFTEGTYLIGALRSTSATDNFYFATGSTNSGDMVVTSNSVTAAESGGVRTVTTPPSGAVAFYFTGDNTNGFTIAPANNATNYLGIAADTNRNLAFASAYSTTKWRVVAKNNALLTNGVYLSCSSGTTYNIFENSTGTDAIRGYKTGEYRAIYLFKQGGSGTLTYMTSISNEACAHTNTTNVAAVAATCTQGGYTAGVYCNDCGTYISGHTATAALGHNYGSFSSNNNGTHSKTCSRCSDVVTANCTYTTSTSGTTTTFTCTVCNYSYTSAAATYTVTYNDRGATSTATVAQGGSVTLPATASTVSGYAFAGWVEAAIATETAVAPTIRTGTYHPSGNVTLYACYTRSEAGQGVSTYTKVSSLGALTSGTFVITSKATGKALSQTVSSNYVRAGGTYTGDTIASPASTDIWTISDGIITYDDGVMSVDGAVIGCSGGALYSTGAKNISLSSSNSTGWVIVASDDGFQIKSGTNVLCYNSSGGWRPYNGGYGSDQVLYFYKLGTGSTTYYTTSPTGSEPTTYTVTYNDRGSTTTATCTAGSSVTLPAAASTVSGYTFAGWVAAAIATETAVAPTIRTGTYHPSGNVTLYACYTRSAAGGGSASLVRMTAGNTLADGDRIVIVADGTDVALYQETISTSYVNTYTFDSSVSTVLADDKNYVTVNVNNDGFTLGDATNGYLNSSSNNLYCNSTEQTWTLSDLGDGTFRLQSDGRNLSYRSDLTNKYWRMGGTNYGTSGNTVLRLYKLTDGAGGTTTYYTTAPTASEPTTYTVTYNDRGSTTTATCTAGSSVTLPAAASTVDGYTFAGWVPATIAAETTTAPTVLTGSYTPSANVTLYACYTRSESSGGSAGYALASGALAAGDQVIVALKNGDDYYALPNANSGGVAGKAGIALTVTGGIATADSAYTFVIYESSGHLGLKSSEAAYYIGLNSSGKISCNGWGDTKYLIFTEVGGGLYTITSETNAGRGLVVDGTSFKANDSSADNVYIFKYSAGGASTTYYTTAPTAAGLSFVSAAPILNQKIDMVYTASVPSGYTNPYMTFAFNGTTTTVTNYTTDNGSLKFKFTGINPQCMGDTITATLYATKNGTTESVSVANYSVKEYCVNKLADNTISSSLRKLLSDLLAYGAAAQTYMNYKTNALVTSGVTGTSYSTFSNLSGNAVSFDGTADANTYWISAGLTLTDSVAMTFRFYTTSVSDLIVYVTLGGRTETYTSFTSVGNGVYEISFTGISAEQFGNTVTAVFERDEEEIGNELSYSVNAYVQSKQNDSSANLKALVRALYNYGVSAAAYAG